MREPGSGATQQLDHLEGHLERLLVVQARVDERLVAPCEALVVDLLRAAEDLGDVVTVTVSAGPEPVVVPNVVQTDFAQAKQQLEAAGFKVDRKNSWGGLIGRVVDQSVDGGQTAPKGATITLTVV